MAASTGIEIGCFNIAYLCELNPDNIIRDYFKRECTLRYFNHSIIEHDDMTGAHSYALNKMADFHFNRGVSSSTSARSARLVNEYNGDIEKALELYALSYLRGEYQVIFILKFSYTIKKEIEIYTCVVVSRKVIDI
jgi:hypothetical protein